MNGGRPLISIVLPTRNSMPFLDERIRTIAAQTLTDWEVIAIDGHSDDGTLERLSAWSAADSRVRLESRVPDGIYPAINRGVELARGAFIYIATSDDTMEPDCLATLHAALEAHPECGIAQCCLAFLDRHSRVHPTRWTQVGAFHLLGNLYFRPHLRRAPLDGYLHFGLETVYTSLTQLLIRRHVFGTTGPFRSDWGPAGDFHWGILAGLHHDVVHIPRFLATWRLHSDQASARSGGFLASAGRRLAMLHAAFAPPLPPACTLRPGPLFLPAVRDYYQERLKHAPERRRTLVLELLRAEPAAAARIAWLRLRGTFGCLEAPAYIRARLKAAGLWEKIIPLD
jgi:hypothetical protein